MRNKYQTYPLLRILMVKHDFLTQEQMGKVMGTSAVTFSNKINGKVEFIRSEMRKIRNFFNEKGENLTLDSIFCDWDDSPDEISRPTIRRIK